MAVKRIKTILLFKRGKAATWTSQNPTLMQGEPGFETDTYKLKIGDGETAWNSLAYFAGGGSGDLPVIIEDPQNGQILTYNSTLQKWQNVDFQDGESIVYTSNGLSIKGYSAATNGYMLVKDATQGIAWVQPVTTTELDQKVQQASQYATAAATSASNAESSKTVAGNYATQAIAAAAAVEGKYWYGTMAQYNALDPSEIKASSIYIILD